MTEAHEYTVGVEEEFFVVDAETRALRPRAEQILEAARRQLGDQVELELNLSQIEAKTPVSSSLDELRGHLIAQRCGLMAAAERHASRIAATGTHPFSEWLGQQIAPKERYAELDETYRVLVWEQLICGCHVHIGMSGRDAAVRVMDRIRAWLPVLGALTANSPFREGVDTGYASYRTQMFDRWPTAGLPPRLGDLEGYQRLLDRLVATDTISDESKLFWDARLSAYHQTLEFRVSDVCPTVGETVVLTGLIRSLVRTADQQPERAVAWMDVPDEVLRAARWRAARYGLEGTLVDVEGRAARPAAEVVRALLDHLREDLEEHGEWRVVVDGVEKILQQGNGAQRQRRALTNGSFTHVVDAIVAATAPSTRW